MIIYQHGHPHLLLENIVFPVFAVTKQKTKRSPTKGRKHLRVILKMMKRLSFCYPGAISKKGSWLILGWIHSHRVF